MILFFLNSRGFHFKIIENLPGHRVSHNADQTEDSGFSGYFREESFDLQGWAAVVTKHPSPPPPLDKGRGDAGVVAEASLEDGESPAGL